MTKSEAARLGGLALLAKRGIEHFRSIGKKGAEVTWNKYQLIPTFTREFAMVDRETGKIVAYHY